VSEALLRGSLSLLAVQIRPTHDQPVGEGSTGAVTVMAGVL